ncbi:hypothetical protein ACLOJK_023283 [Asimina triloba]
MSRVRLPLPPLSSPLPLTALMHFASLSLFLPLFCLCSGSDSDSGSGSPPLSLLSAAPPPSPFPSHVAAPVEASAPTRLRSASLSLSPSLPLSCLCLATNSSSPTRTTEGAEAVRGDDRHGHAAAHAIKNKLRPIIERKKSNLEQKIVRPTQDMLSHMLVAEDEQGREMSETEVLENMLVLLFASQDTTSCTITVLIKHLTEMPEVYQGVLRDGYGSKWSVDGALMLPDPKLVNGQWMNL